MAKLFQANHGGPSVARTNREKSIRALSIGKKTHITFPIAISAIKSPRRRGCTRTRILNAAMFAMRNVASTIAMINAVMGGGL